MNSLPIIRTGHAILCEHASIDWKLLCIDHGQTLTNDDSQTPLSFSVSVDNVVRELWRRKSWKAYAESIPSVGYVGGDATGPDGGQFYTRHVRCRL